MTFAADYLDGGAAVSGSGVQTLDVLVVVVPPDQLLGRLVPAAGAGRGAADGNVFPALGRFVDGIRYVCVFTVFTALEFLGVLMFSRPAL